MDSSEASQGPLQKAMSDELDEIGCLPLQSAANRFIEVLQITDINRRKMFELACIFGYHSCLGDASYAKLARRLGGPSASADWHRRAVKIGFLCGKWGQDFYVKFGNIWPPNPSRTVLEELTKWIHIPLNEAKTHLQARIRDRSTSKIAGTRRSNFIMIQDLKDVPNKPPILENHQERGRQLSSQLQDLPSSPPQSPQLADLRSSPVSPEIGRRAPSGSRSEDYIHSDDMAFEDEDTAALREVVANSKLRRKRKRIADASFRPLKSYERADPFLEDSGNSELGSLIDNVDGMDNMLPRSGLTEEEEGAGLMEADCGFDDERGCGDIPDAQGYSTDRRGVPEEEEIDRNGSDDARYACDFPEAEKELAGLKKICSLSSTISEEDDNLHYFNAVSAQTSSPFPPLYSERHKLYPDDPAPGLYSNTSPSNASINDTTDLTLVSDPVVTHADIIKLAIENLREGIKFTGQTINVCLSTHLQTPRTNNTLVMPTDWALLKKERIRRLKAWSPQISTLIPIHHVDIKQWTLLHIDYVSRLTLWYDSIPAGKSSRFKEVQDCVEELFQSTKLGELEFRNPDYAQQVGCTNSGVFVLKICHAILEGEQIPQQLHPLQWRRDWQTCLLHSLESPNHRFRQPPVETSPDSENITLSEPLLPAEASGAETIRSAGLDSLNHRKTITYTFLDNPGKNRQQTVIAAPVATPMEVSDQKNVAIAAVETWLKACSKEHETSRQRTETARQSLAESEQGLNDVIREYQSSKEIPSEGTLDDRLKTLQDDSDRRARLREQAESSYKEVVSARKQLESELGIEGRALQKVEEVKEVLERIRGVQD